MTVRRRILVLQLTSLVALVLMTAVLAFGLWHVDHAGRRIDGIHGRLQALNDIIAKSGNYGEEVATALLIGHGESDDLETVRIGMERALARLTSATRAEIATLSGMDEIQDQLPEIELSQRIVELYHSIDASTNRALALQRARVPSDAKEVFRREVEFRLANELQPLIVSSLDSESTEVAAELDTLAASGRLILPVAGGFAALAILAILILGISLRRTIEVRLIALVDAARALVRGDKVAEVKPGNDEFGEASGLLSEVSRTLQDQKRQFAEAGERLSSDVEARTAQLRAANDRLREIDRKRGQFLADVSHELRTPLTILRGEADVALRGKGNAEAHRQTLERIQGQAVELGQLLEDLINFARSEAEDSPYVLADTRLADVVSAAVQEADVLARPREIELVVELNDHNSHLDADFRRLKQAVIIGLDNAIKHSPPGGRIVIGTHTAGSDAIVTIEDEGSGIAEADLPRVFERFFRGSQSMTEGVGIGLAIAGEIVERHLGSIALANRSSGGAILTIKLPLAALVLP